MCAHPLKTMQDRKNQSEYPLLLVYLVKTIKLCIKIHLKFVKTISVQILVATMKSSSGNGGGTAAAAAQWRHWREKSPSALHSRQRAVQRSVLCCSDDELPVPEAKLR